MHGMANHDEVQPFAKNIIDKVGGYERAQEAAGVEEVSTVYRWTYPISKKGTGGIIPLKYHPKIIAWARRRRIALTAADFFALPEKV